MGYTHHFKQNRTATPEEWARITEDLTEVLKHTDVPLCYDYDKPNTPPQIDHEAIVFNGLDDDGHETFFLQREKYPQFNFCKTARKPYDIVVCAALIIAEHHAPGAWDIGSDGDYSDPSDDEWGQAFSLVKRVLGDGYEVPAGVKGDE